MARPPLPMEACQRFWGGIRAGLLIEDAAEAAGVSATLARRWFRQAGGVNPMRTTPLVGRYLSLDEREELMRLDAAGHGVRAIARILGRDPSTVSRELKRGHGVRSNGYRASLGQAAADRVRRQPRGCKLATNLRLRREVQDRLTRHDSPEQIAGRLKADFPDDPEMWVSHETIYQAIYVQSRGGLKRELAQHLRTGRSLRKPHRKEGERRGRIPGMVMISERPPEIEDRAVPGHWEGDLIMGEANSAVGTLVERTTGFAMLLHLPNGHGALEVQEAIVAKMGDLPEMLRRSLTWDQGKEMSNHVAIAEATGLDIYFCDPHSPWQRGSNENTNGLLRQYMPKGTDLSFHGPGLLDLYANELNSRPRKRFAFRTPAEVLEELLSEAARRHGVA